jgi:prepilin-type N-terminal cleavage/methylation domain-containing protein
MQMCTAREAGYTLVEILIAVAIIGIVSALAMPDLLQWQAQSQLRQATSEIANQMTLARMAGMNRNRAVDVTVQNSGGQIHISALSSSGASVISDKSFTSGVMSVVASPVTVSFSSLGIRTNGGTGVQTIGVCDRYKRQYSVTIIPSGKVNWSLNSSGTPCP